MVVHEIDYDTLAAAYARNRQVHPKVLEALAQAVPGNARVLEVGCGTGNYIIALASLTGAACWGVDPSAGMLEQARDRLSPVHFEEGRAEELEADDGFFDLVFSVDVVHHLDDLRTFLSHAHRVLKPGGQVCTVTDSASIIRRRQPLATYFPETVEPELARYPRIALLRALMEQAGFDEIAESTVEWAYQLSDIEPYRTKAYSALHLISQAAFQRGIARMQHDLQAGPISCVSRYALLWGAKKPSTSERGSTHDRG